MSDLQDLYQELIIDHSKRPRNFRRIEGVSPVVGHNPLCGDKLALFVCVTDGKVSDVAWEGAGCAISTASASLMTDALKGKSVEEAERMIDAFHRLVTGEGEAPDPKGMGKLAVFEGVKEYPSRVKCANLAWRTMRAGLEQDAAKVVSTE